MIIYFIGYIAAGKNKWGKKVADELNYNFVDTRDIMEQKSGVSFGYLLQNKELFNDCLQHFCRGCGVTGCGVTVVLQLQLADGV